MPENTVNISFRGTTERRAQLQVAAIERQITGKVQGLLDEAVDLYLSIPPARLEAVRRFAQDVEDTTAVDLGAKPALLQTATPAEAAELEEILLFLREADESLKDVLRGMLETLRGRRDKSAPATRQKKAG